MTKKFRLLDMYSGAGGAGRGYQLVGFDVVGVDIISQPKSPYRVYRCDAIRFLQHNWMYFDAVHASPPCQAYSNSTRSWKNREYPILVEKTRDILQEIKLPYIIENVVGAPLKTPILLCGTMFGLSLYRHRLFETSFWIKQPQHIRHINPQVKMGRRAEKGEFMNPVGNFSGVEQAKVTMEVDWMGQKELAQAIPPRYTQYIGSRLIEVLSNGLSKEGK